MNIIGLVRGGGGCRISGEEKVRFFHRDPENPRKMIVIFNIDYEEVDLEASAYHS